jgi:hypothetical protein
MSSFVVVLLVGLLRLALATFPIDLPTYSSGYVLVTSFINSDCSSSGYDVFNYMGLGVCYKDPSSGDYSIATLQKSSISSAFHHYVSGTARVINQAVK